MPVPIWLTLPLPDIAPPKVTMSERLKTRAPLVAHIANDGAGRTAITQLQRSRRDGGAAGIAVGGGEDGGAGADLADTAAAGDRAVEAHHVGTVEGQGAIVGHVANDGAGGSAHCPVVASPPRWSSPPV